MRLRDKKVIALVEDEFEDLELWYPIYRLREEGAVVHLVGKEKDNFRCSLLGCRDDGIVEEASR